jgi:hypothetical protein
MDEMNPNITADILYEKTNNDNSNPTGGDAKAPEEFNPKTEFENDDTSEDEDVAEDTTNDNDDVNNGRTRTRSGRQIIPPSQLNLYQEHIVTQTHEKNEYTQESQFMIAKTIHHLNHQSLQEKNDYAFLETFGLNKGLKHLGPKGYDAAVEEVKQLHDRRAFKPIQIKDMSQLEKQQAMESLIFLTKKRDGRVKTRACANGSTQREYINEEDTTSPTILTESILITATIDAREKRDIMTADIPNAFIQTNMDINSKEKVIMKIRGSLVDILVSMDPTTYKEYVTQEGNHKVLYVQLLKAVYGTLQAALLFYKKLKKDLESIG